MYTRLTTFSRIGLASALVAVAGFAANTWQKEDPSQWTGEDVYQILNNSPWSKSVTTVTTRGYGQNDSGGGTWGEGVPGGGMGRTGGGWAEWVEAWAAVAAVANNTSSNRVRR